MFNHGQSFIKCTPTYFADVWKGSELEPKARGSFLTRLRHLTPQWGAADEEIKVPSGENTELNVLPLKPGVGQYIAIHATLTARDFFLAYFYTSSQFTCIFFQILSRFFPVLAVANTWFLCRPAE